MTKGSKTLTEYLKISPDRHRLIGVVGAGGKTTLIYLLAKELTKKGYRVAITTTTHMQSEGRYGLVPLGTICEEGKIKGFSVEFPRTLLENYDVVLVEADGSRCLPMKVPAEHEPVLPMDADLIIGVAGASAVGKTFQEACHRYERVCRELSCGPDEVIRPHHIIGILTRETGQKKGVRCEYRYVINQIDVLSEEEREEMQKEMQKYSDCGCMISLKNMEEDGKC
ncbi:MAG: selenium cofactor biosynthesis protein YqeC [Eubacteriales bacterium]|nr:selenium cofactor biosynthesis protein YqeC [Eubacteriales bacterium]